METLRKQIEPLLDSSIGLERFKRPVVAADGQSYEKEEIENWFKSSSNSPTTGLSLSSMKLYPNILFEELLVLFPNSETADREMLNNPEARRPPTTLDEYLDRLREILTDHGGETIVDDPVVVPDGFTYDVESLTADQRQTAYPNQIARKLLEIYWSHRPRRVRPFDPRLLVGILPERWTVLLDYTEIPLDSWAGTRPLLDHVFSRSFSRTLVQHLITHGSGLWARDSCGRTMIHYLASHPKLADLAVTLISKRVANMRFHEEFDAVGKSPSMYAVESENIMLLIAYYRFKWSTATPPYLGDLCHTPITYAMTEQRWSLLLKLLDSDDESIGFKLEFKRGLTRYGKTVYPALHLAAEIAPMVYFFMLMCRLGASSLGWTDESGRSVLYIAMLFRPHREIVALLEKFRVEVVPKRCCIEHGVAAECLNPFCSALEDNRQLSHEQKESIRRQFATADQPNRGQFLHPFAISQLRQVDEKDKFLSQIETDRSHLYGRRDLISTILLDRGWKREPALQDQICARIWEGAVTRERQRLTDRGCSVGPMLLEADNFGENLMHVALRTSATGLLFEMFEAGVELFRNRQGETPLLLAIRFAVEPVILTLIETSPPDHLTAPNRDGRTPLNFAVERKMEGVVEALTARLERV